mgnify:FL=1
MNRKSLALVVLFFVFLINVLVVNPASKPTIVNGHVYESDGRTPAPGKTVEAVCNGLHRTTATNNNGFYAVEFLAGCDFGSIVEVKSGGAIGYGKVANEIFSKNIVYINLILPKEQEQERILTGKIHDLKIKSLFMEKQVTNNGNKVTLYVRIKNEGNFDEDNVKLRIFIQDLDVYQQITMPELSKNQQKLKIFEFEIPRNIKKGVYLAQVKVFDENSGQTRLIELEI